jgi:RNA polymerase sigma-70 factor, ECF subfamily
MKSNEQNFIKRLQMEKEDALEYIVDHYLPLVKGISYKVLGPLNNDGVLEECVNDIFLSIWHHAKTFNGDNSNFKYWIASIARFKAIDYYRKSKKNLANEQAFLEIPAGYSVENEVIMLENQEEILALIRTLDPIDQKVMVMRYFLEMDSTEISSKLGITKSAVDNRIYRGRKKLTRRAGKLLLGGSIG